MSINKVFCLKTLWTKENDDFLRDNFFLMTNKELAEKVGKKLTVTRMRCRELGLKKIKDSIGWTTEQVNYLQRNFKKKGDVLISEELNEIYKTDKFNRKNIRKKRCLLGFLRNELEVRRIMKSNYELTDRYIVVNCLRIEKDLREIYMKNSTNIISVRKKSVAKNRLSKAKKSHLRPHFWQNTKEVSHV